MNYQSPSRKMVLEAPSGKILQRILEELNEKEEDRHQNIAHIKEWLKKEPHLPDEFDDERILSFLRGCKFSLEKCKRKLDMYFTVRTAFPEFFKDRDIRHPELQEILTIGQMPVLPALTPDGYRVTILRGIEENVIKSPNFANIIKIAAMIADIRLAEDKCYAGDVFIFDTTGAKPFYFFNLTPSLIKKFIMSVQEAYPTRLKQIHFINVSPLIETIVNSAVKPFLKQKIRERVFMHSDLKTLLTMVPQEILANEYGGNAGSMNDLHNAWNVKIDEYRNWFAEQECIKSNESLRQRKIENYDDLFGRHGSFRQLSFD